MRSATFIIPVGTHVVLRSDQRISGGGIRPAGSVAQVLESPTTNQRPYKIRFLDGAEVRVSVGALALRRDDPDSNWSTPGTDLNEFVIYRVVVGSRAFGLSTEASDEDRRGVFLPPAAMNWSLFKPPEQIESTSDHIEEVDWELEKFLRLALQANPNILETLWSPMVLHMDDIGREMRDLRSAFLSRHIYKTYSGYVLSQFRLMERGFEHKRVYKPKHAMHLIRLLHSGIHALREGDIRVDVAEHRDELMQIRSCSQSFAQVRERALELNGLFQAAFTSTNLPERPDYDRVDQFLIEARRRRASESVSEAVKGTG